MSRRATISRVISYRDSTGARRWKIVSVGDIVANGGQGYSRAIDMRAALWSVLEALLRWAYRVDAARAVKLCSEAAVDAPDAGA